MKNNLEGNLNKIRITSKSDLDDAIKAIDTIQFIKDINREWKRWWVYMDDEEYDEILPYLVKNIKDSVSNNKRISVEYPKNRKGDLHAKLTKELSEDEIRKGMDRVNRDISEKISGITPPNSSKIDADTAARIGDIDRELGKAWYYLPEDDFERYAAGISAKLRNILPKVEFNTNHLKKYKKIWESDINKKIGEWKNTLERVPGIYNKNEDDAKVIVDSIKEMINNGLYELKGHVSEHEYDNILKNISKEFTGIVQKLNKENDVSINNDNETNFKNPLTFTINKSVGISFREMLQMRFREKHRQFTG